VIGGPVVRLRGDGEREAPAGGLLHAASPRSIKRAAIAAAICIATLSAVRWTVPMAPPSVRQGADSAGVLTALLAFLAAISYGVLGLTYFLESKKAASERARPSDPVDHRPP
jgi:hypothetical protein